MAARRNPKPRRTPAAATPKPAPKVEAKSTPAPVQTQAAEAAADALIADARAKAEDITRKALDDASTALAAANEERGKLVSAAEQAAEELRDQANARAERLLTEARTEASRLRDEAEGYASNAQAEAELAANRIEGGAEGRAAAVRHDAREEADDVVAAARQRAERIGETAAAEAQQIVRDAKAEAEQLLSEARTAADRSRKIIDAAKADAEQITRDAKVAADGELTDARNAALRLRDEARLETEIRERRDDKLDTWSARLVIAGAVGLTASGEYELARMVGFDAKVAWLLPLVIDVYVVQAFRRHRDIIQAIALTIAANVIFHLADKGLFGVEPMTSHGHEPTWWLIALVASVASLILWRMHLITSPPRPPRERRRRQKDAPQIAESPRQEVSSASTEGPAEAPPTPPAKSTTPVDNSARQEPPVDGDKTRQKPPAKKPTTGDKKPPAKSRQKQDMEKAPRRSMSEWVALTEPIFHDEFKRLKRNPTASEFADAIKKAGHGRPSDSTAKNIRTEILDRAPLPSLGETE